MFHPARRLIHATIYTPSPHIILNAIEHQAMQISSLSLSLSLFLPIQASYTILPYFPIATCGVPYSTCEFGSPGAMKFVSGFPVFFAAEHLAMVGELKHFSNISQ